MNSVSTNSSNHQPPTLAIVANCLAPYRVHLHALIAAGIPEFRLQTLVTHDVADFTWDMQVPDSISATYFGRKGDSPLAGPLRHPIYEWRKGGRLIRHLEENNTKAVICNNYRYISYLRVIDHFHRSAVPLFVNNDSNIRSELPLLPWTAWAKRRTYAWWVPRVAGIMPMGSLGDEFFVKYGADPRRFYRVPVTPDYDIFAETDVERLNGFRQSFGLRGGRRYLLFSGRLVQFKRVDLLIDAFVKMAADRPEWDLLIAGDGPLRGELHRRVPEGLRDRVVWTGFLELEDLKLAYQAADVLVLPSDLEPWAIVVQEAMAAGLVVIATDVVGASRDLVTDNVSGRIVPTSNVELLRQAILDVTNPARLDEFKKQSRLALKQWREERDPVQEVRRALIETGVLRP